MIIRCKNCGKTFTAIGLSKEGLCVLCKEPTILGRGKRKKPETPEWKKKLANW